MVGNRPWMLVVSLTCSALMACVGCGGSSAPPESADGNATSAQAPAASGSEGRSSTAAAGQTASEPTVERHVDPKQLVQAFLTSLKSGDPQRATAMLSTKAQQEMARTDAMIQPPGSPTATFEVTEVEYLGDKQQGAHVMSVWTDVETDGQQATHEIVWILRKESLGWAVAGFATTVFPDQPPLILNFEDPQDLQRKRSAVDAEIARRSQLASPQQADLK